MSSPRTHHRNWDEFRWEQEIQRDERRINCYFRTLPSCLDLPGEEEMVNSTIAAQSDLLPGGETGENIPPWSYLQLRDDDESSRGDAANMDGRRSGEYMINTIDALASQWNLHCALKQEIQYAVLSISCAYAKLLARCADFFDVPDNEKPLKRCLGKRAQTDLVELNAFLELLTETAPEEAEFTAFQQKRLQGIREQLSRVLEEYK